MRPSYSEYVRSCIRFYARCPAPNTFRSEVDRKNWQACEAALAALPEIERNILLSIYGNGDTVPDNVFCAAKAMGMKQSKIWKLVDKLEREIAGRRGLI